MSLDDPGLTCPVCDWPYPKCHCDEIERKEAMNMDKTMLTPRKVEALVAAYCGQNPTYRFAYMQESGKPWWVSTHRGGGASWRMVQELRDLGYLTEDLRHSFEPEKSDLLTVKGYNAILEHVGPSGQLHALIDFDQLEERRADRARFEAARNVRIRQHQERESAERNERAAKAKAERVAKLRALFDESELGQEFLAGLDTDDELLDFADRVASI